MTPCKFFVGILKILLATGTEQCSDFETLSPVLFEMRTGLLVSELSSHAKIEDIYFAQLVQLCSADGVVAGL